MALRGLRLCFCALAPTLLQALLHKHKEKALGGAQRCSLNHYVSNELSLLDLSRQSEFGCRDAIVDGVDFVSFKRKPKSSPLQRFLDGVSHIVKSHEKPELAEALDQRHRTDPKNHTIKNDEQDEASDFIYQSTHHLGYETAPLGEACWETCPGPGYCEACGSGNACCRKDFAFDPPECHKITTWRSGTEHECVETEPWLDSEVVDEKNQLVVWVSGYPRSGSSILLSMVSATVDDNMDGGHTFSLFEPCHGEDSYDAWMQNKGCRQLLYEVAHCDFRGIEELWGWRDPHSSNGHSKSFSKKIANNLCQNADIVAFKTVDWGHNLKHWKWLLDTRPNMKVLDVVRDPRAIYASWKKLEPFKSLVDSRDFYTIGDICDHFAKNLEFHDKRVHRVIFEDLMTHPENVTRTVYGFLGEAFTSEQEAWLSKAFNAAECPPPPPGMKGYTDCHTWTGVDPRGDETWRSILNADELSYFEQSRTCQLVAKEYNYPAK